MPSGRRRTVYRLVDKRHLRRRALVFAHSGFRLLSELVWRGGRVVEGARLERVYTGNRIEGSNPSLSASSCH